MVFSIEFEVRSNFVVFWFKTCSTNHKEILHTSRQLHCCDVCKILLWLAEHVMNKSITKFHWISNFIQLSLVGRATRDQNYHWKLMNSQIFPFIIVFISSDHHETPLTLLNNEFIQTHMLVFMCKYHIWMQPSDDYLLSGYCEKPFIGLWEMWPLVLNCDFQIIDSGWEHNFQKWTEMISVDLTDIESTSWALFPYKDHLSSYWDSRYKFKNSHETILSILQEFLYC